MNIGLIFAGGTGSRMNVKTTPKQFLTLHGKEIIIHTLEHFEECKQIDSIIVVCIEPWIEYLKELLMKYSIKKVKWIVEGGETGQDSIYNGVKTIYKECPHNSIVLVHDGVRPLIDTEVIENNIACVEKFGTAITVVPSIETVIMVNENECIEKIADRKQCMMAKAPQSFYLKELMDAHQKARKEGKHDFVDSASIMSYYGYKLKTVQGSYENIKITTPSDYYIFRALSEAKENKMFDA